MLLGPAAGYRFFTVTELLKVGDLFRRQEMSAIQGRRELRWRRSDGA